ncbi:MAG TPA: cytochrome c oxidase subunit I [Candidatus Nitrosotenuis sp.]|jgi:cytochrome c oxidase subunit 1|nr:cytochrome c oxidase subunit I [Candidatus Nitrosotenuis sp.]
MAIMVDPQYKGFLLPRPTEPRGLVGWLTTVDHKRIAILYGVTAFLWMLVGGLEALLIRTQLMKPNLHVVSADVFNQLFTMHGTTMIFLVVMPMSAAFFNLCVPLMIGARDVAFPRLNAFSYWMFLAGSIFLNSSWFLGLDGQNRFTAPAAPNGGWFGYVNLTGKQFNPGTGIDFWTVGLILLGISSTVAALNFIVTIVNLRCPGMTMMRMPVFVWMTLVVSFLIILAFPAITIALVELTFDRMGGTNFFEPAKGGLPILWQHLFWIFGHPEVYILILPAMGIVSEVLPVFSRKPLFGAPVVILSGVAIGFIGFGVWAHHMFTTGMGPVANSAFALTTMAIAVPTGVKIFNWVGTLWGGQIRYKTPLLFAVGFVAMFMIGGFSGLTHAAPPGDAQQQDTYYVVAHFHYVLIGGALFGLFSGIYYWFPKAFGKMLTDKPTGRLVFWLLFIGFNLAFFPMHFVGLNGMPRRIYTYPPGMGWETGNFVETIGAYIMGVAILLFFLDVLKTFRSGQPAPADPWDGRTLEWSIPSPPPEHNFDRLPTVTHRDQLWVWKHPHLAHEEEPGEVPGHEENGNGDGHSQQAQGHGQPAPESSAGHHDEIHIPGASWFPLLASAGFLLAAYGLVFRKVLGHVPVPWIDVVTGQLVWMHVPWLPVLGALIGVFFLYCWALEPIGGKLIVPEEHHA